MKKMLTVAFVFFTFLSQAQKEGQELVDSLLTLLPSTKADTNRVNVLNELSFNYQYIDPAIGHQYAQKALALAEKINWNDGMAFAYRNIGVNHSVDSDFENALENYGKALKATKNKKIVCKVLRNIGLIYTYKSDYSKALDYDMRALKMSEEVGDRKSIAAVLSNIGIVYYDLKDFRKALNYYKKAQAINEKMGNDVYLSNNLGNIANTYNALKQFPKAIEYYQKAITINDKMDDKNNKAINLGSMASAFLNVWNHDKALQYANESLILSREVNDERMIATNNSVIGGVYIDQAKDPKNTARRKTLLDQSFYYYSQGLAFEKRLDNWIQISFNYEQLSEIEMMRGSDRKALEMYRLAMAYKDSVFNDKNKQTIKNLEDQRAIELRDKQIQLNKVALLSQEREKWLYIIGITFLLIIAGLVLIQSRNRKKTNETLQLLNTELDQANKIKSRFFSILNHDLRSPVASLIGFLHLQKESPELLDEHSKKRMETKTITSAENLLDSMEDLLLWSKGQMENFKPQPQTFLVDALFEDLQRLFASVEKVRLDFENPQHLSILTDENYLKTILRNLIGNAVKALERTPDAHIQVTAVRENGIVSIAVSDNGPGGTIDKFRALYDENEVVGIKSGLGLHLIRDLASAIGCKVEVDTTPGSGTTFRIIFP